MPIFSDFLPFQIAFKILHRKNIEKKGKIQDLGLQNGPKIAGFSNIFAKLRFFENRAPACTGAQFLQNRRFRFKSKNPSKNHRNSISQIKEKLKKS